VQRSALVLRHVMGYSVNEIAELSDVSPNTVKDRLLRGTREMRRLIRRDVAIGTGSKGGSA
jgi:RNA polymerase sigma-70 factor (ECF subfamily)